MINKIDDISKLASQAMEKPSDFGYWGYSNMFVTWGFSGIDKTRDSSLMEISNFDVISQDLMKKFPNDFRIEGFSHWAVGHVDRLTCRILKNKTEGYVETNITEAFKEVIKWHEALSEHPVADESHYGELEFQDVIESLSDLPYHIADLIDQSNGDWAEKIYYELAINMHIEMCPDASIYPSDDDIKMAIYNLQLWNIDAVDEWNEWTDLNGIERIPFKKENPNQLKLFED